MDPTIGNTAIYLANDCLLLPLEFRLYRSKFEVATHLWTEILAETDSPTEVEVKPSRRASVRIVKNKQRATFEKFTSYFSLLGTPRMQDTETSLIQCG